MGTIKRKAPPRKANPARKKREFARAYHSRERVLFVKGLPCSACGFIGVSENAHIETGGTGRKADARWVVPLCGRHIKRSGPASGFVLYNYVGCHNLLHHYGREEFEAIYGIELTRLAAETEAAWQSRISETEP